jgi:hypothetical protein
LCKYLGKVAYRHLQYSTVQYLSRYGTVSRRRTKSTLLTNPLASNVRESSVHVVLYSTKTPRLLIVDTALPTASQFITHCSYSAVLGCLG